MRIAALAMLISLGAVSAEDIVFPAEAKVIDVTAFGAVGDGRADDTAALQAAIQKTGLIYLPAGTYRITAPLKVPPREGSAPARRILQGAGTARSIIRVDDSCPAFADPEKPVPVFQISWGVAQAFRNGIRDLTIDVGAGNPGAIGCAFMASNQGGMHRVALRAGQGSGAIGVNLAVGDNGPLLLNDLDIEGFSVGVATKYGQSMTLEHLRIRGARIGVRIEHSAIFLRGLDVEASEVAVRASQHTTMSLLDSRLRAQVGVRPDRGIVLLRGIDAADCTTPVEGGPKESAITTWSTARASLPEGGPEVERLEVAETPRVPWGDATQWQVVGRVEGEAPLDTLRAAAATGSRTLCLGSSGLELRGTFSVPATVERIIGCEREPAKSSDWTVVVDEPSQHPLVIERFDTIYARTAVVLKASRPVVVSSMNLDRIVVEEGAGPLFVEDCIVRLLDLAPGTRCWARQINMEYVKDDRAHARNVGGRFWCFGFKNEGDATMVATTASGRTEMHAYVLANKATPSEEKPPLFVVESGTLALTLGEAVGRKQPYAVIARTPSAAFTRERTEKRGSGGSAIGLLEVAVPPAAAK